MCIRDSKNIDEPKKTESTKGITLKNISYQYKKQDSGEEKYAIKDISLAIEPGEFVAIIGRTGSGTVSYTHLDVYKRQT